METCVCLVLFPPRWVKNLLIWTPSLKMEFYSLFFILLFGGRGGQFYRAELSRKTFSVLSLIRNPPNKYFKVEFENDNEAQVKYIELKNSFASSESREPVWHSCSIVKILLNTSQDSSNSLFVLKFYCLKDSDSQNLLRGSLD